MDVFHEYILPTLYNLNSHIPPSLSTQIISTAASLNTSLQSLRTAFFEPYIISPLYALLNSPPDLSSILVLLVVLVISIQILDYMRRLITFWVRLIFRIVFWMVMLGGAWYVYSVGWERAAREAGWLFGLVGGFIEQLLTGKGDANRSGPAWSSRSGSTQGQRIPGWRGL